MQEKYNHMQDKVETTKQTLQDAETTLARQDKIRATVKDLQERAKSFEEKTAQRQKSSALFASEICSGFEFPKPLIDYDAEEEQQIEKQIDESIGTFFPVLLILIFKWVDFKASLVHSKYNQCGFFKKRIEALQSSHLRTAFFTKV